MYFLCAMGYHRQNLHSSHDLICQSGIKLDHSMSKKTVKDQEAIMNLYCSLACSRLTESERLKKQVRNRCEEQTRRDWECDMSGSHFK